MTWLLAESLQAEKALKANFCPLHLTNKSHNCHFNINKCHWSICWNNTSVFHHRFLLWWNVKYIAYGQLLFSLYYIIRGLRWPKGYQFHLWTCRINMDEERAFSDGGHQIRLWLYWEYENIVLIIKSNSSTQVPVCLSNREKDQCHSWLFCLIRDYKHVQLGKHHSQELTEYKNIMQKRTTTRRPLASR